LAKYFWVTTLVEGKKEQDPHGEVFCGATALHLAAAANQLRAMDVLLEVIVVVVV
jgi:hypothetical protein